MRLFMDRSSPFYVTGTELTFIVPFTGDAEVLNIQPQQFTWSSGGADPEVVGNEVRFTFVGTNLSGSSSKNNFDNALRLLKQNLQSLKQASDSQKNQLEQLARQLIGERKNKLLADAKMVADLGFPIKKRDGAATTYAVPVQKRRPKIERPPATSKNFRPEPALAMEEYENTLTSTIT